MPIGHTALFPGLNKWPKLLGVSDSSFWTRIYETISVYGYVLGQPKNKDCSKKASYSQWQAKFSFSTFFAEPVTLLRTKISPGSCANITLHTYPRKKAYFRNITQPSSGQNVLTFHFSRRSVLLFTSYNPHRRHRQKSSL